MKKTIICLLTLAAIVLTGCDKLNTQKTFDKNLVIGKWQSGTEFWVYQVGGIGHTWDTNDDVAETEAQDFYWEMDGNQLIITHMGEMGELIPKPYTLILLTSDKLQYRDNYNKTYSFTKVP